MNIIKIIQEVAEYKINESKAWCENEVNQYGEQMKDGIIYQHLQMRIALNKLVYELMSVFKRR